ncbi:MAG: RNA 2',3'-cyclic phosphodiesterase [Candidatus Wildermuthbacteria bacterium]|nr:RNA 2',3'-cyclic phosphodiesterase [Candidatus Wildermuthbacteria bacterium]
MNLRRIFIAINLPEDTKHTLLSYQEKWQEMPARWTTPENLHVTLAFLGSTSDKELEEVYRIAKETAARSKQFSLTFEKIIYGPQQETPRMIWAVGDKTPELLALQNNLEKTLSNSPILHYQPEKREFNLHITLARLREWEFQRIEPEERSEVNENISVSFPVRSIEAMESKLKRSGAEYAILQSFPLL